MIIYATLFHPGRTHAERPVATFEGVLSDCPIPEHRKNWIRRLAGYGETSGMVHGDESNGTLHWRVHREETS
jgi:hypothetical protein